MLVEVTDGKRTTYRYRHKLSYFGLKPKGRKWTLTTSDNDIVDYINSFAAESTLQLILLKTNTYAAVSIEVYIFTLIQVIQEYIAVCTAVKG